jgi:hypothetical protein
MWNRDKLIYFSRIVRFFANSRIMPNGNEDVDNLLVKPIRRLVAAVENDEKKEWSILSEQTLGIIADVAGEIWYAIDNRTDIRDALSNESIEIPMKYKTELFDTYYIPTDEPMTWQFLHTLAGRISRDCQSEYGKKE